MYILLLSLSYHEQWMHAKMSFCLCKKHGSICRQKAQQLHSNSVICVDGISLLTDAVCW